MADIQITYDTLMDLSRRERNRPELQKLEDSFYADVISYLKEKQNILVDMQKNLESFDLSRQQDATNQLNNARKLVRDIYERRERKIVEMALNRSRTKSDIIDTSSLLKQEKKFHSLLEKLFTKYREGVLNTVLATKDIEDMPSESENTPNTQPSRPTTTPQTPSSNETAAQEKNMMIRFLHAVPKFVGTDLDVYGPYEVEDIAKISTEIAKVLIEKGRAERIEGE